LNLLYVLVKPSITILVIVVMLNVLIYLQQPSMIFYPDPTLQVSPEDWKMNYEDVTFSTSDGVELNGWFIPGSAARKTVLFFHGNAGNISHREASIRIFHDMGVNVFIFDYRGYGKSQGSPSEHGLYLDATAAWDYLLDQKKIKPENIILFGRSLGGAVASQLATQVKSAGLILESTFTSARDMAKIIMPVVSYLVVMRYQFNSISRIKNINQPLLVLHSPQDDIISYQLGVRLFKKANEPKTLVKMRGDHNNGFLRSQPEYEQALKGFIN